MINICIYGNPTVDEIWISEKHIETRIGGGVYYSAQPFLKNTHKYNVYIEGIISPQTIELLSLHVCMYPHFSPRTNYFKLVYDNVEREIIVLDKAPPLINPYTPVNNCISIVNPVLGEIDLSVLKMIKQKSRLLALDIQGFVRRKEGNKVILYRNPEAYEAIEIADILHLDLFEASIIAGRSIDDLEGIIHEIRKLNIRYVIVTRQYNEPILITREQCKKITYSNRILFKAEDKVGAGDYFLASIVKHYIKHHSIEYAIAEALHETDEWLLNKKEASSRSITPTTTVKFIPPVGPRGRMAP